MATMRESGLDDDPDVQAGLVGVGPQHHDVAVVASGGDTA